MPVARLYFLHLPKAAGSTVLLHLRTRFRADEVCLAQLWYELVAIPPAERARKRLFAGHFAGVLPNLEPGPFQVATVLRDPVERAWSHHRFAARHPEHPLHLVAVRGLPALLADPFGRQLVSDVQSRQLAIDAVPPEWRRPPDERDRTRPGEVVLDPDIASVPDDELVERALARLESCAVVGVTEELHASVQLLSYAFGWDPVPPLPALNTAPDRHGPSPEERALLTEHNQLDARVYDAARARFQRDHRVVTDSVLEARVDRRLAEESTDLVGSLTVDLADPIRGTGWVHPQPFRDGTARWTGRHGARLDVAVRTPAGTRLELLVPAVLTERNARELAVTVDGRPVPLQAAERDGCFLYSGVVPGGAAGPFTRIALATPEAGPLPGAGDGIDVGVAVVWIRLTAP